MNAVLGIIRHVLTTLGGGLVTNGTITDSMLETGVGAVLTLIAIGWSIFDKKKREQ